MPSPASTCVEWDGPFAPSGYGKARHGGQIMAAHRAVWLEAGRQIPRGHHIHHTCLNKRCVNLAHLECHSPRQHGNQHRPAPMRTIRDIRLERDLTIRQFEDKTSISRGLLSLMERGHLLPSRAELDVIELALGLDLGSLEMRVVWIERDVT